MGKRGLEFQLHSQDHSRCKVQLGSSTDHDYQERSDGHGSSSSPLMHVAALDERNLKRATHRYGTMPKDARIGAYLESLRQSGMTPEPVIEQGVESDATFDSSSQGGSDTFERSAHNERSSRVTFKPEQVIFFLNEELFSGLQVFHAQGFFKYNFPTSILPPTFLRFLIF